MDDTIVLYSTHCARCKVIAMKLQKKNIQFKEIYINPEDPKEVQVMLDMGLRGAPGLVVNGKVMDFLEANKWIEEQ